MTIEQAAALRVKWKQRVERSPCEHLNLELEWNDLGHSTGNYVCIICGEPIAQKRLTA
jgi:hypothetical protein